jgi:hypothetical protein
MPKTEKKKKKKGKRKKEPAVEYPTTYPGQEHLDAALVFEYEKQDYVVGRRARPSCVCVCLVLFALGVSGEGGQ